MADTLKQAIDELSNAPKTNIKGKQYSQVATRVEVFRKHFGLDYGVTTELLPVPEESLVRVRATITNADGAVLATGMAEEDRRNGNINKTAALENCETSAIGRALAAFGLHGGEYATADEVQGKVAAQETTRGAKPVTGQYGVTELKKKARELAQDVRDAPDRGALLGLLNAKESRDVMNQLISDLPQWWHGDGQDSAGLKGLIDNRKQELYDVEQWEHA
jgi:hypothetical protein